MKFDSLDKVAYVDRSDFRTHLNYAKRMAVICRHMTITTNISLPDPVFIERFGEDVKRFGKLSALTAKSIDTDRQSCQESTEFSLICAPWLPVKCYYRLYYLEAILLLMKGYDAGFRSDGHHKVRSILNAELRSRTIKYNTQVDYLGVFELHDCYNFTLPSQSLNIKNGFWRDELSTKSILKLIARYKFESWKKDKNLRTADGKRLRGSFMVQNMSLFDYPYQMRLKANYKDLNFLDPDRVSAREAYDFIQAYYIFYSEYSKALASAIKVLYPKAEYFIT